LNPPLPSDIGHDQLETSQVRVLTDPIPLTRHPV
jgi:hypothetical protein